MGFVIRAAMGLLLLALLAFGFVMLASEMAGETVTLRSYVEDGPSKETSLWVVDDRGQIWLRAGQPGSKWLARLSARPQVELIRGGVERRYRAVVMPRQRDRINRLMAEKYGWVDRMLGMMRDASAATPIRLDPIRR